jgi:hypothetical protein
MARLLDRGMRRCSNLRGANVAGGLRPALCAGAGFRACCQSRKLTRDGMVAVGYSLGAPCC